MNATKLASLTDRFIPWYFLRIDFKSNTSKKKKKVNIYPSRVLTCAGDDQIQVSDNFIKFHHFKAIHAEDLEKTHLF